MLKGGLFGSRWAKGARKPKAGEARQEEQHGEGGREPNGRGTHRGRRASSSSLGDEEAAASKGSPGAPLEAPPSGASLGRSQGGQGQGQGHPGAPPARPGPDEVFAGRHRTNEKVVRERSAHGGEGCFAPCTRLPALYTKARLLQHAREWEAAGGQPQSSIPPDFLCPLSLEVLVDPVVVASGQTYERAYIQRWLLGGSPTCPKTNQQLPHLDMVPNEAAKAVIQDWCARHGIALPEKEGGSSAAVAKAVAAGHSASRRRGPGPRVGADADAEAEEEEAGSRSPEPATLAASPPPGPAGLGQRGLPKAQFRGQRVENLRQAMEQRGTGMQQSLAAALQGQRSHGEAGRDCPRSSEWRGPLAAGLPERRASMEEFRSCRSASAPVDFPSAGKPEWRSRMKILRGCRSSSEATDFTSAGLPEPCASMEDLRASRSSSDPVGFSLAGTPGQRSSLELVRERRSISQLSGSPPAGTPSAEQPVLERWVQAQKGGSQRSAGTLPASSRQNGWPTPGASEGQPGADDWSAAPAFRGGSGHEIGGGGREASAAQLDCGHLTGLVADLASPARGARKAALEALLAASSSTSAARLTLATMGVVPPLGAVLDSEDPDLMLPAVTTLLNLSLETDLRLGLALGGVIPSLVDLVHSADCTPLHTNALSTICNLSSVDMVREELALAGVMPALLAVLDQGDSAEARRAAAGTLVNLSLGAEARAEIISQGAVELLLELIEDPLGDAQEEGLLLLCLLAKAPAARSKIQLLDGVHLLAAAAKEASSLQAQSHAVATLLLVASGSEVGRELVRQEACLDTLHAMGRSGTQRGRGKALALLKVLQAG